MRAEPNYLILRQFDRHSSPHASQYLSEYSKRAFHIQLGEAVMRL